MSIEPIRTDNYTLSIIDPKSFVVVRKSDGKQSEIYCGMGMMVSYECFKDSHDFSEMAFNDLCELELN